MYSHQNIIPPGPGCLVHVRASSDAVISLPTHTIDISASLMHSNKPVRLYTAHEIDIRSLSDLLPLFFYLLPILMPYPRARVGEFFHHGSLLSVSRSIGKSEHAGSCCNRHSSMLFYTSCLLRNIAPRISSASVLDLLLDTHTPYVSLTYPLPHVPHQPAVYVYSLISGVSYQLVSTKPHKERNLPFREATRIFIYKHESPSIMAEKDLFIYNKLETSRYPTSDACPCSILASRPLGTSLESRSIPDPTRSFTPFFRSGDCRVFRYPFDDSRLRLRLQSRWSFGARR